MDLNWVKQHYNPLAQIGRENPLNLYLTQSENPSDPRRARIEQFIRQRFAAHYQANIRHFMPWLIGLENASGQVQGAFGLRNAECGPLFLERYLDKPIEEIISPHAQIRRSEIIEVGNLAAAGAASARFLIVALTDLLVTMGLKWVVFTGTPALLNSFRRLDIELMPLAKADPQKMGHELADWGSYYDAHPQVTAGDVLKGHRSLALQGMYLKLGYLPFYAAEDLPHVACC